jgi:hypothetical protein
VSRIVGTIRARSHGAASWRSRKWASAHSSVAGHAHHSGHRLHGDVLRSRGGAARARSPTRIRVPDGEDQGDPRRGRPRQGGSEHRRDVLPGSPRMQRSSRTKSS